MIFYSWTCLWRHFIVLLTFDMNVKLYIQASRIPKIEGIQVLFIPSFPANCSEGVKQCNVMATFCLFILHSWHISWDQVKTVCSPVQYSYPLFFSHLYFVMCAGCGFAEVQICLEGNKSQCAFQHYCSHHKSGRELCQGPWQIRLCTSQKTSFSALIRLLWWSSIWEFTVPTVSSYVTFLNAVLTDQSGSPV